MLVPIKTVENNIMPNNDEITYSTFKDLNLKEGHIEEFLRKNIEVIFGDEKTLLIIGQRVNNKEKGRSDLTAIDENGNIVLIEIKRGIDDIKNKKEAFEFHVISYAASYTQDKVARFLIDKIFSKYIEKHKEEFDLGGLTTADKGKKNNINRIIICDNQTRQNSH